MKDKKISTLYFTKKITFLSLLALLCYSCVQKDIALETFKGDMIYSFLLKDTTYSEYVKIIDRAGLKGMLSAYGEYTCLVPTNKAIQAYYHSLGNHFTLDSLTPGQVDTLAKTHIISNTYLTNELSDGVIPNVNMNKRYIEVKFTRDSIINKLKITLNDSSQIISKDNEVYNGVIHGIDHVLKSSNIQLPDLIAENTNLSIFMEALKLTGLQDSLRLIKDVNYHPTKVFKDEGGTYDVVTPPERKYGYTALIEDNDVLRANNINNLGDLIKKANILYPDGKGFENDFTNRNNSLNQYISYHLINKAVFQNKFFYTSNSIKNYTPDEFLETMLKNRIIRVSKIGDKTTFNGGSDSQAHMSGSGTKTTINGVYHLLDNLLIYNDGVEKMLQNTRIRFDIVSLFPEMINNSLRGSRKVTKFEGGDRFGFEPGYFKYIKMSKDTRLLYLAGMDDHQWANYQSDELMGLGAYDITMRLLPVPPGTYELRFGYSTNSSRSVTQIYLDNKPVGIPLDLRVPADDPKIGYIFDNAAEDNGFENDKMMHNRGYMKAPNTFVWYDLNPARDKSHVLRRVIGIFTFTDYEPHYLRFKSVMNDFTKACMMDYFEYVPKNVFNPANGEPEGRD